MADAIAYGPATTGPRINTVDIDRPWAWLSAGWRDLYRAPGIGLAYGAMYALIGFALTTILWLSQVLYLSLPIAAMFTFVGPIAAVGLYQVSRNLAAGEPVSFAGSLRAWKANPGQIAFMGVALLLFALAWMRIAFLLFMLFFGHTPMAPEALVMIDRILQPANLDFLIIGTVIGAILCAVAFAISVVSLPILLDHPESNIITAILTSLQVVKANFWVMALWAWLIAIFVVVGLATLYIGLIITLPLIGHASWHAYKDLVGWDTGNAASFEI